MSHAKDLGRTQHSCTGCWLLGDWRTIQPGRHADRFSGRSMTLTLRAIACAVDLGVRFFDTAQPTAPVIRKRLGRALATHPEVLIGTKIELGHRPGARCWSVRTSHWKPSSLPRSTPHSSACNVSASTLCTCISNSLPIAEAAGVFDTLDTLRAAGKIVAFGWSTDYPDRAEAFGHARGLCLDPARNERLLPRRSAGSGHRAARPHP